MLTGRANAHQRPLVRAFELYAADHLVAFGESVQDSGVQIGEGRDLPSEELAAALNARRRARRQSAIHEAGCEQGKDPIRVLCVDQVAEPLNQSFVLFG